MGVVIEICVKYPGGRTRITVTGIYARVVSSYSEVDAVEQRYMVNSVNAYNILDGGTGDTTE
jgi:hypothetical protein